MGKKLTDEEIRTKALDRWENEGGAIQSSPGRFKVALRSCVNTGKNCSKNIAKIFSKKQT